MISRDGEELRFSKGVAYDEKPVETWLAAVEDSMKKAIHDLMARALVEYNKVPLLDWIAAYPIQVCLLTLHHPEISAKAKFTAKK